MSSSSGKLLIPGLKLSGAETKDGSAAVGKGNVVIMKSPTAAAEVRDTSPPLVMGRKVLISCRVIAQENDRDSGPEADRS